MTDQNSPRRIVLATGNGGKLREMRAMLSEWEVIPQSAFVDVEAEETALSFVENALIKARHACASSGLPAIADDSGLEVSALDGRPGVYSARFAGVNASDDENIDKLLGELDGVEDRRARFRCVLVYMKDKCDPSPLICEGVWEGVIGTKRDGLNGFGYDPIFITPETGKSAARLSAEEKNRYSHRGKALVTFRSRFLRIPTE